MVLLGVQLAFLFLPVADIGTISLGPDVGVPLTILLTVLTVNALNFIDGLDGLAAGVSAIAALAFFAYSYHLGVVGYDDVASAPALITAVLAGACLGFLPHNFSPARIFMGDSGSMLVGLMLSAAAVTATGGVDPQSFDSAASLLPLALPLLVPIAILFIPFVDLVMAVVRRTLRGQSPFSPDKMHLHHRLLSIGHSHRRAVLVMYFWAALLSFGAVALSITGGQAELLVAIAVLLVVGVVVVLSPRARRAAREARAAELAAQRERSRADHPTARAVRAARAGEPVGHRPPRRGPPTRVRCSGDRARPGHRAGAPWDISFLRVGSLAGHRSRHRRRRAGGGAVRRLVGAARRARRRRRGHRVLLRVRPGHRLGRADRRRLHAARRAGDVPGQGAGLLRRAEPRSRPTGWSTAWPWRGPSSPAALLWSAVQARWVWTRQLYYVTPPSPPPSPHRRPPRVPADPERPATRG